MKISLSNKPRSQKESKKEVQEHLLEWIAVRVKAGARPQDLISALKVVHKQIKNTEFANTGVLETQPNTQNQGEEND